MFLSVFVVLVFFKCLFFYFLVFIIFPCSYFCLLYSDRPGGDFRGPGSFGGPVGGFRTHVKMVARDYRYRC